MSSNPVLPDEEFRPCLSAARAGDEGAWKVLYRWLAPQVLGFLRASRVADPEDVLGNVFLDVAGGIGRFRGDARGFRAWVFTIARGRRIDEIRRRARRSEDPLDTAVHDLIPAAHVDVEAEALAMLGLEELLGLLDHLTDDQGEILVLRAVGGWTSREIGEITGRTTGSVEQLHHRARLALRELLEGA